MDPTRPSNAPGEHKATGKSKNNKPPPGRRQELQGLTLSQGPSLDTSTLNQKELNEVNKARALPAYRQRWLQGESTASVPADRALEQASQGQSASLDAAERSPERASQETTSIQTVQRAVRAMNADRAASQTPEKLRERKTASQTITPYTGKKQAGRSRSVSPVRELKAITTPQEPESSSHAKPLASSEMSHSLPSTASNSESAPPNLAPATQPTQDFNVDVAEDDGAFFGSEEERSPSLDVPTLELLALRVLRARQSSGEASVRYGDVVREISEMSRSHAVQGALMIQALMNLAADGEVELFGEGPRRCVQLCAAKAAGPADADTGNAGSVDDEASPADDGFLPMDDEDDFTPLNPVEDEDPAATKAAAKAAKEKARKDGTAALFKAQEQAHRAVKKAVYQEAAGQQWQSTQPNPTALVLRNIVNAHFGGYEASPSSELTAVSPDGAVDCRFRCCDVLTLRDPAWLEDSVITGLLRGNVPNAAGMHGTTQLADQLWVTGLVHAAAKDMDAFDAQAFQLTEQCDKIVCVLNEREMHWLTFTIERDARRVRIYDSWIIVDEPERQAFRESWLESRLRRLAIWACARPSAHQSWALCLDDGFAVEWMRAGTHLQQNSHDCGVHAVKNAVDLVWRGAVEPTHDALHLRYRFAVYLDAMLDGHEPRWGREDTLARQVNAGSARSAAPNKGSNTTKTVAKTASSAGGSDMPHILSGLELRLFEPQGEPEQAGQSFEGEFVPSREHYFFDEHTPEDARDILEMGFATRDYVSTGVDAGRDPIVVPPMPLDAAFTGRHVVLPDVRHQIPYREAVIAILQAHDPRGMTWEEVLDCYKQASRRLGRPLSLQWRVNIRASVNKRQGMVANFDAETGIVQLIDHDYRQMTPSALTWFGNDMMRAMERAQETSDDIHTRPDLLIVPVRHSRLSSGNNELDVADAASRSRDSALQFLKYYLLVHWGRKDAPVEVQSADQYIEDEPCFHVHTAVCSSTTRAFQMDNGRPSVADEATTELLQRTNALAEQNGARRLVTFIITGVDGWTTNNDS